MVDAGYRGELLVLLADNSCGPFHMARLQAVAQAIFEALAPIDPLIAIRRIDNLSDAARGVNSFGSSDNSGPHLNTVRIHAATTEDLPHAAHMEILYQVYSLGHFHVATLAAAVRANGYKWPEVDKDAESLVASYHACQLQTAKCPHFLPLVPIAATCLMDQVALNLSGPLQVTESGNTYMMVIVDVFT
ncbi:hypothetical protein H4S08_004506 [Coemansia sp. RSA 1365]|nr:hypothetical protein H4S08_004506 [Coemansia sp. RSA 1365]